MWEVQCPPGKKVVVHKNRETLLARRTCARVGRHACDCLLDTGSDVTLIPASMVVKEDVKGSFHTLSAANGTDIPVLGEVSLPFSVGEIEGMLHGLVLENIGDVMLGIDWMTNNAVTWEFGRSRIKIGKQYYSFKSRSSTGIWCRRVVLQNDVVLPSRSEVDLLTTIVVRRQMIQCLPVQNGGLNPDCWFLAFIRHVPLFQEIDC